MTNEEIKKFTIRLRPKTVKYFDRIIGQLRLFGVTMSMNEVVGFMAWNLQKYVPEDVNKQTMTKEEADEMKKEIEQFRKEMKEAEG